MIFAYVLLAVLICTAAAIVCTAVFGLQKNKTMRAVCSIGLIVCAVMFAIFGIGRACTTTDTNNVAYRYEDLMLYYSTVDNSTNEYVRYDYYDKVQDYNEFYQRLVEASEDPVFGCLYPRNWTDGIGTIDFQLHGDDYGNYPG